MAGDSAREKWDPRDQVDEEMEFFTELALHETERWIQVGQASGRKIGAR